MKPRRLLRDIVRRFGFDIVRYNPQFGSPAVRKVRLLHSHGIDLVFDVGANTGQYAKHIRNAGFRGRIVSFEPLSQAYAQLAAAAHDDPHWETLNMALGDADTRAIINVSANSQSSSLLGMLPEHLKGAPKAKYVGTEEITIKRLDSILDEHKRPDEKLFVKLDAQGYEKKIMEGAAGVLDRIAGVQMEVSLVPLYEGETLLPDMLDYMSGLGYTLMGLEPGFWNLEKGQLLQTDCIFFRGS